MNKTAEQIANDAEHLQGRANTAAINRAFRLQDDSDKWPVCGRFSVIERAIRKVRKQFSEYGEPCEGLHYALAIEAMESEIVNTAI